MITYSIKGLDSTGREVTIAINAATQAEYAEAMKNNAAAMQSLKALPVPKYGGPGSSGKKAMLVLPNAPMCKDHADIRLGIREGTNQYAGKFYWHCTGKGVDSPYCKAQNGFPTPAQVAEWKKLNGLADDKPTIPAANGTHAVKHAVRTEAPEAHTTAPASPTADKPVEIYPSLCATHNVKMIMNNTGVFYHKLPSGDYCNGLVVKPAKTAA